MKIKAFTLIEILIIVCIIALLTAIVVPNLQKAHQRRFNNENTITY